MTEEIPIEEFRRRTSEGVFVYVRYQGRVLRRESKAGRPHYTVVTGLQLTNSDRIKRRRVNVNSQVARYLLAKDR